MQTPPALFLDQLYKVRNSGGGGWSTKIPGGFAFLTNSQVTRMSRSESYTLRTVALKLDYRDVSHASSPTARTLRTSFEKLLPTRSKVCLHLPSPCI